MPAFTPFRGFLYDRELVPHLEEVTAPPYDVIDEQERQELLGLHPWNAAHLHAGEPDEVGDRYSAACRRFQAWTARGILRRDPEPRLYLYRQGYRDGDGKPRQTSGVIGAIRLEQPGDGVLPHERTLPKPLGDRLHLLRACRVNLSPIYLLSPTPGLSDLLEPDGPPRAALTDPQGVHHRLYDITASGRVGAICEAVASSSVVIADGHHRYQTALAFLDEVDGQVPGAGFMMAFVVELSADQLQVHPIHRLLRAPIPRLPQGTPVEGDLPAVAQREGSIVVASEPGRGVLLEPPPPGTSAVVHFHESVAPSLSIDLASLEYEAKASRIDQALREGATAFYLPPVGVSEIAAAARARECFPEKTTFFTPKARTGLVFRSLVES